MTFFIPKNTYRVLSDHELVRLCRILSGAAPAAAIFLQLLADSLHRVHVKAA